MDTTDNTDNTPNPWEEYAAAYTRVHELKAALAAADRPALVTRLTAQLAGARRRAAAAAAATIAAGGDV